MAKALDGLSVIDISGSVSTEYCSKVFSDYGAEVINLEPESGFETRKIPPFISGKNDSAMPVSYTHLTLPTILLV